MHGASSSITGQKRAAAGLRWRDEASRRRGSTRGNASDHKPPRSRAPAPTSAAIRSSCSVTSPCRLRNDGTCRRCRGRAATPPRPRHATARRHDRLCLLGDFGNRDIFGSGQDRQRVEHGPAGFPARPSRPPARSSSRAIAPSGGTTMSGRPACITRSPGSAATQGSTMASVRAPTTRRSAALACCMM